MANEDVEPEIIENKLAATMQEAIDDLGSTIADFMDSTTHEHHSETLTTSESRAAPPIDADFGNTEPEETIYV